MHRESEIIFAKAVWCLSECEDKACKKICLSLEVVHGREGAVLSSNSNHSLNQGQCVLLANREGEKKALAMTLEKGGVLWDSISLQKYKSELGSPESSVSSEEHSY